jgi:hypothetical protein
MKDSGNDAAAGGAKIEVKNPQTITGWHPSAGIGIIVISGVILIVGLYVMTWDMSPDQRTQFVTPHLINLLLLVVVAIQAYITQKQWQQSRELFELAERPSLGVEKVALEKYPDGTGRIIAKMRNSGKSPARKVKTTITLNFYETGAFEPSEGNCPEPHDAELLALVSLGVVSVNAPIDVLSPLRPPECIRLLEAGDLFVMVWIRCTYESIHGRDYFVKYYARFSIPTGAEICGGDHNDAN